MKKSLLRHVRCPVSGEALFLVDPVAQADGDVVGGSLQTASGRRYPIVDGIPRLLDASSSLEQDSVRQVQDSFGRKWCSWRDIATAPAQRAFYTRQMADLVGCGTSDLARRLAGHRMILDAGCGAGWKAREFASNDQIWCCFDLSESVLAAQEQTRHQRNVHVLQADVFHVPFERGAFDLVLSDGVIHHTPDPAGAVRSLSRALAPGGVLAVYVYAKKPPIREFVDRFLRDRATALSFEECVEFCKPITQLGESLARTGARVTVPADIPSLQIKAGEYDLQRFLYYHVMKCFHHQEFTFEENNLVNVDWYHPFHASTHTEEEVASWFAAAGLSDVRMDRAESGIFASARRPGAGTAAS